MKNVYRIMDIFVHPSRIVFYFRDKAYIVIIHLIVFISLALGVTASVAYSGDYIDRRIGAGFEEMIFTASSVANVKYENYELSGDAQTITYDAFRAYFNYNEPKEYTRDMFVIVFSKETVKGYYYRDVLFEKKYKDLKYDYSFEFNDIKAGNNDKKIEFTDFMTAFLDNFEKDYATQVFIGGIATVAEFYIIALVLMLIFSFFVNPTIKFDVRAKLIIYDSLIFFFIFSFAYILNVEFFEYLAVGFALFYSNITFRHIIRIDKNRKYL